MKSGWSVNVICMERGGVKKIPLKVRWMQFVARNVREELRKRNKPEGEYLIKFWWWIPISTTKIEEAVSYEN